MEILIAKQNKRTFFVSRVNDLERPSEVANFRLAEKNLQKSKPGRLVIAPTGFGGEFHFLHPWERDSELQPKL